MRNPDSLNAGEPGRNENIEQHHLNCSSLHFASQLSPPYRERLLLRPEACRVGSDWPTIIALHLAIIAPLATATRSSPACDTCGAVSCANPSYCEACRQADSRLLQKPAALASLARPTPQTTI